MTALDLAVLALAAVAAFRGWHRGLLGQVFELGGAFVGLVAGVALGPRIASALMDRPGLGTVFVSLIVVFAGLSFGQVAGLLVGRRFGAVVERARLGGVDAGLGAALGVVVAVVSYWLIGSLLVQGPVRPLAKALRDSRVLESMNDLAKPPDVLAYLSQYLTTSGFPQVFAGLPPEIGPPVKLPPAKVARRAATAARRSTVRIVVPACGGAQLGSGWVAAPSTVVTNAHVVAGGDEISVQDAAGQHPGVAVVFDDRTDVAVIHAEGLAGPPLRLDKSVRERGAAGAALGYPGVAGGSLHARAAAIQGRFEAVGRDIYGRSRVARDVYELRARVHQGDSGGPFVLANGRVAGVLFAASTTDRDTGYALTGREVADEVARGSRRSEPVSTGACTH